MVACITYSKGKIGWWQQMGQQFCVFYTFQTIWSGFATNFFSLKILIPRLLQFMTLSRMFQQAKFSVKICKSTPNGLKRIKKHKTADPSAAAIHRSCRQLIFSLEYVNTSYHTTFHQNLSINVACIHKRVLVA